MRRKLSGWGWAAVGAVCVFLAAQAVTTIITAIKQNNDEERITKIERIVIHRHRRHHKERERGVIAGSGTTPHGQTPPGQPGGLGNPGGTTAHPHSPGGENHPHPSGPPGESPAPTPAPQPSPPSGPANPPPNDHAHTGVVESVGPTVGETVTGATETVCSTTAAVNVGCP